MLAPADIPEDPLAGLGLAGFGAALRRGATSARHATCSYLERIARLDPQVGAFRAVDARQALSGAKEVDRRLASGEDLGPLMGVPIAVKELFRIGQYPFTAGSDLDISDLVPPEGPFVHALRQAGCIVLGVTRSTEFAMGMVNADKPDPWNPADPEVKRTCGGSSKGSAAALAAGLCGFAVGSDTGGSVRVPAALCGQVGLKPSMGVWSTEGAFPLSPTFDTVGIFTHSAEDAALVFAALTGGPALHPPPLRGLKLGRVANLFDGLDQAVEDAVAQAIGALQAAGVTIVDVELPEAAEVDSVFNRIVAGEIIRYLGPERIAAGRHLIDAVPLARMDAERDMDDATLEALRQRHRAIVTDVARRIGHLDAILSPTAPRVARLAADLAGAGPAAAWSREVGRITRAGNLLGLCGISLPVHVAGALPVGLQLACAHGEDQRLIRIAMAVESVVGRGPDYSHHTRFGVD